MTTHHLLTPEARQRAAETRKVTNERNARLNKLTKKRILLTNKIQEIQAELTNINREIDIVLGRIAPVIRSNHTPKIPQRTVKSENRLKIINSLLSHKEGLTPFGISLIVGMTENQVLAVLAMNPDTFLKMDNDLWVIAPSFFPGSK